MLHGKCAGTWVWKRLHFGAHRREQLSDPTRFSDGLLSYPPSASQSCALTLFPPEKGCLAAGSSLKESSQPTVVSRGHGTELQPLCSFLSKVPSAKRSWGRPEPSAVWCFHSGPSARNAFPILCSDCHSNLVRPQPRATSPLTACLTLRPYCSRLLPGLRRVLGHSHLPLTDLFSSLPLSLLVSLREQGVVSY